LIGAKTLTTLALLVLAGVVAFSRGFLKPERLLGLSAETAFLIGSLATVLGALLYRFCRLSERSAHYFRFGWDDSRWEDEAHFLGSGQKGITIGQNRGEAFDLHRRLQLGVCLVLALLLCLGTIDARGVQLLGGLRATFSAGGSGYCPDPDEKTSAANDPNAPGCALIRRAHELGFAKSLGDCARATRDERMEVCTRRQRDEPLFHYGYRLIGRAWSGWRAQASTDRLAAIKNDFVVRLDHLEVLARSQEQVMASAPHASHHIWTNLSDPGDGAFDPRTCVDRYRELPRRPPAASGTSTDRAASKVLEHVLAQLLFESRYEPAAGYCREYQVHWGAPLDACARLAQRPEVFLATSGALERVRATLLRHRLGLERDGVEREGRSAPPRRSPTAFISFHCYMEGAGARRTSTSRAFALDGQAFSADDLQVPGAGGRGLHIDRYAHVARLLAPNFHYGALLSEAGIQLGSADDVALAFAGKDFLLTRVQSLASLDIFLEPEWIAKREDLLEVYPYHLHLKNYVHLFRRHYLRERGRL
jgi:hypothetical protein